MFFWLWGDVSGIGGSSPNSKRSFCCLNWWVGLVVYFIPYHPCMVYLCKRIHLSQQSTIHESKFGNFYQSREWYGVWLFFTWSKPGNQTLKKHRTNHGQTIQDQLKLWRLSNSYHIDMLDCMLSVDGNLYNIKTGCHRHFRLQVILQVTIDM